MANLLQKASIVLTPTAYDDGKVLCAKPSKAPYGDFDFSRNSAATRVNAQGLVENVQILSSNLVQNGDFSEEGAEEVSNGSFSQEGSELITNGDFSNGSTGWELNPSSGTAIVSNGKLNFTNSTSSGTQVQQKNRPYVIGKTYKITFTVTDYIQGGIRLSIGNNLTTSVSANGTFTQYITYTNGLERTYIYTSGSTGSIDNVSVREVGQDWNLGTGWSIGEDKLNFTNVNGSSNQSSVFVIGKTYKITVDYTFTSGTRFILPYDGRNYNSDMRINTPSSAIGYTYYYTPLVGDTLFTYSDGNGNGSITNISVKEVGQNWSFTNVGGSNGWRIANERAICDTDGVNNGRNINSSAALVNGKTYKLTLDILQSVDGMNVIIGGTTLPNELPTGTNLGYEYYIDASQHSGGLFSIYGGTSDLQEIDNISIIEITDDTNLPRINYEGFSYDGSGNVVPDSGCGSWLWEPQSTNLITQSELFSDAYWTKIGTSVVGGFTSPSGDTNAFKFVEDTSSVHGMYNPSNSFPSISNASYSIFVKYSGRQWVRLFCQFGNNSYNSWFDILNGVIGTSSVATSDIQDYGNGWFKITQTNSVDTINGRYRLYLADADNSTTYTGDGVSGVYIWGAQAENQSYATSYIPTSGSTVTRNQDVCANSGSLATINSTEGTLYGEFSTIANDNKSNWINISDGTAVNWLFVGRDNNNVRVYLRANNSVIFDYTTPLQSNNKVALSYKSGDIKVYINGVNVSNSTNAFSFTSNLNSLDFNGYNGGGTQTQIAWKAVAVWKEALSDQELADLTYPTPTDPTFALDFDTIATDFTFARGSEATYVDAQGLIQSTASNNTPRLDYSTGAEAFLLEPQSTNLITQSNDFDTQVKVNVTVTSNAIISPDGTLNADKLVENSANSQHYLRVNTASSNPSVISVFAKKGEETKIFIGNASFSQGVLFDLNLGVIESGSNGTIEDFGNGWYRCSFYRIDLNSWQYISLRGNTTTYQGNGVNGVYLYGLQLEELTYATSYIPTSGSTVTRNQETCINATPEINSEEGVLYFEAAALANDGTLKSISLSNGTTQQRIIIRYMAAENQLTFYCIEGGNTRALITTSNYNLLEFNKIAASYKQNDFKLYVNGVLIGTDNNGNVPSGLNQLNFNGGSGEPFFGNTKDVQVYTKALSDAELIKLTT